MNIYAQWSLFLKQFIWPAFTPAVNPSTLALCSSTACLLHLNFSTFSSQSLLFSSSSLSIHWSIINGHHLKPATVRRTAGSLVFSKYLTWSYQRFFFLLFPFNSWMYCVYVSGFGFRVISGRIFKHPRIIECNSVWVSSSWWSFCVLIFCLKCHQSLIFVVSCLHVVKPFSIIFVHLQCNGPIQNHGYPWYHKGNAATVQAVCHQLALSEGNHPLIWHIDFVCEVLICCNFCLVFLYDHSLLMDFHCVLYRQASICLWSRSR